MGTSEVKRKTNSLYCYAGEDVTLIYYYLCRDCGTVILEDHSMEECLTNWACPTCSPVENFPFKNFSGEELRGDSNLLRLVGLGSFDFFCGDAGYQYVKKRTEVKRLINCLHEIKLNKIKGTNSARELFDA